MSARRLAIQAALFLAAFELLYPWTGLNRRLLEPQLPMFDSMGGLMTPLADPERRYGLAPGDHARLTLPDGRTARVHVDRHGFRGPEHDARKPPGVTRILALGGSNTFGVSVADGETYPARMQARLDARCPGEFEVWNGGHVSYVLRQKAAQARAAARAFDPDLILVQHYNRETRFFLIGDPFEPYFDADPSLYSSNLGWMPGRWTRWGEGLLRHWRLYRAAVLTANLAMNTVHVAVPGTEERNERAFREFLAAEGRDVPVVMLKIPAWEPEHVFPEFPGVPTLDLQTLLPADAPPVRREVHPDAATYDWYARVILQELARLGRIPARCAGP